MVLGWDLAGVIEDAGADSDLAAAERGITTHTMFVQDDRDALGRLAAMLAEGSITARVAEVIPLTRAHEAYEAVARGASGGKRVLDPTR